MILAIFRRDKPMATYQPPSVMAAANEALYHMTCKEIQNALNDGATRDTIDLLKSQAMVYRARWLKYRAITKTAH